VLKKNHPKYRKFLVKLVKLLEPRCYTAK
jgi:hypothetical protein